MNNFFQPLLDSIDFVIVGLVLLSGFFQKRYFSGFKISKANEGHDSAMKTLLVSAVVSVVYILLIKDPEKGNSWSKYFISYFAATSLYELIISPFTKWIQSKFGNTEPPKD